MSTYNGESSHWYSRTGEPCHWQPKVDGSGQTPTTIRHARKLGLLPSPTSILKILDKPALTRWMVREAVQAVVTAPDVAGEGIDAKIERVLDTERQQDETAQKARDLGTEIHNYLEAFFTNTTTAFTAEVMEYATPAAHYVATLGTVIHAEHVLVGEGYAGKTDLILRCRDYDLVVDWKTTKTLPKASYPDAKMQLSAYASAWQTKTPDRSVHTANCYISTTEMGSFAFYENPPWYDDFSCFEHLLNVWCHLNEYDPRVLKEAA